MSDRVLFNEIALNQREVTHKIYGSFIVKRPTNRILSLIETAMTKSSNRDLQAREVVVDPETGKTKKVPQFLTKNSKMKLLEELGEWSEDDSLAIQEAESEYRRICSELHNAGYIGLEDLLGKLREVYSFITSKAKEKNKEDKVQESLAQLFPMKDAFELDTSNPQLPDQVSGEEYIALKKSVEKTLKDIDVVNHLDILDSLHKQYGFYLQGLSAQTNMLILRLREISLFSDTIEARADFAGRLAKVFYCSFTPDLKKVWESIEDCEDSPQELINWFLSEVERLERLDPAGTEEDLKKRDRFNFLSPLAVTKNSLENSDDQRLPKEDGASAEKTE